MKKAMRKRAAAIVLFITMVFSVMPPAQASAKEVTAPAASQSILEERTSLPFLNKGILANLRNRLAGRFGGGRINPLATLPTDDYQKMLYGSDTTRYALGVASQFVMFGRNVNINSSMDAEGRVAADELYMNVYNEFTIKGLSGLGEDVKGTADVVVNNSVQKAFGYVHPDSGSDEHIFVVSEDVTHFLGKASDIPDKIKAKSYTVPKDDLIDFDRELASLTALSAKFVSLAKGSVSTNNGTLTLTGTDTKVNIFNVTATQLSSANGVSISVPKDSFVIVNVSGKSFTYSETLSWQIKFNGNTIGQNSTYEVTHLLFNFYEATKVDLAGPNSGCILAPLAHVEDVQSYAHNFGQIVAREVTLKHEIGYYCFLLPYDYLGITPEQDKSYTVHFMYYDMMGKLHEFVDDFYDFEIDRETAPTPTNGQKGFKPGDTFSFTMLAEIFNLFKNLDKDPSFPADFYQRVAGYGRLRFRVYEDNEDWSNAIDDPDALCNEDTYSSMVWAGDIKPGTYTFRDSNVYFILYPLTGVELQVLWDDKSNKAGYRPEEFNVTLMEKVIDPATGKERAVKRDVEYTLENIVSSYPLEDKELKADIDYDFYECTFTFLVPLFGAQPDLNGNLTDRRYGGGTNPEVYDFLQPENLFYIEYEVPEHYSDVTMDVFDWWGTNVWVQPSEDSIATYAVILRGEYKAIFYVVDPKTNQRTEVYKTNFYTGTPGQDGNYNKFRGFAETDVLPNLTNDEIAKVLGTNSFTPVYQIMWLDTKTAKNYEGGANTYQFDYEDVIFETTVRDPDVIQNAPWLYVHIIRFRESYYVPGSMLWKRLKMDETTDPDDGGFTFIQKMIEEEDPEDNHLTEYSYESLKNGDYDDEEFLMFSFVYGIDTDRAVATRATVSTEGFGHDAEIFYEAEKMGVNDGGMTDTFLGMKGGSSLDIHKLLEEDDYCKDYDGMRYFRLALPADEFVDKNLYFTVYYIDADGQESVWFYYYFDMDNNKYWTITK